MADAPGKGDDVEMSKPRRRLGGGRKGTDERRGGGGREDGDDRGGSDAPAAEPRTRGAPRSGSGLRGGRGGGAKDTPDRADRGRQGGGDGAGADDGAARDKGEGADDGAADGAAGDGAAGDGAAGDAGADAAAGDGDGQGGFFGKMGGLMGGGSKKKAAAAAAKTKKDKDNKGDNNDGAGVENADENAAAGSKERFVFGPMKGLEPMRADPIKTYTQRAKRLERLTAVQLPEVHVIGTICSGHGFTDDVSEGVMVRYKVDFGEAFNLIGGITLGQTQFSYCNLDHTEAVPFNHPIDLHLAQAASQSGGSPRMTLQTYKLDMYGRRILCGYGFAHIPITTGHHVLEVDMWRPSGTPEQELGAAFLGEVPALISHNPLYDSAWKERCRLISQSTGKVKLDLFVMTRHSGAHGIDNVTKTPVSQTL